MGKWIDRAVITGLAGAALYILFLSTFGSIIPAASMAFVCCAILIRLSRRRSGKLTRQQAKSILEGWAYGPDEEAQKKLAALISKADPESSLVYLPKHPSAEFSVSDVFSAWKKHRGAQRLNLASPCYASGRAHIFARTLQEPCVTIFDAARLIPLIRKSDIQAPHSPQSRILLHRLHMALSELPERRPWYKSLAAGIGLMFIYLISGLTAYLILATAMLFLAGVSIRRRA